MTTPDYYKRSGHECRELSAMYRHPIASAIEYVWRHKGKNGVEDLRKALDWLEFDQQTRITHSPEPILDDLIKDTTGPEQRFWQAIENFNFYKAETALRELIEEEQ